MSSIQNSTGALSVTIVLNHRTVSRRFVRQCWLERISCCSLKRAASKRVVCYLIIRNQVNESNGRYPRNSAFLFERCGFPRVDVMELIPAFPDNLVYYHCDHCNAACCGTGDIGMFQSEYELCRRLRPSVCAMLETDNIKRFLPQGFVSLFKPGRCWFLDDQEKCSMEIHYGRLGKPFFCRSFPYTFRRIGLSRVVATLHTLCTFSFEPGTFSQPLSWDEAHTLHGENCTQNLYETSLYPGTHGVSIEQDRDLSEFLSWEVFLRDQVPGSELLIKLAYDRAVLKTFRVGTSPSPPSSRAVEEVLGHFESMWRLWNRLFDIDLAFHYEEQFLSKLLAFFIPLLRFNNLYGGSCGQKSPDLNRFALFPYMILAWYHHLKWSGSDHLLNPSIPNEHLNVLKHFENRFWGMALCGQIVRLELPECGFRIAVSNASTYADFVKDLVQHPNISMGHILIRSLSLLSLEAKLQFLEFIERLFPCIISTCEGRIG